MNHEVDWTVLDSGPEGVRFVDGGGRKVEVASRSRPIPRGASASGALAMPQTVTVAPQPGMA
jgi:hypothetical protein